MKKSEVFKDMKYNGSHNKELYKENFYGHFIGIHIPCGGIEDNLKRNKLHVGHKLKSTSNIINIGDLGICYNVNLVKLYEYNIIIHVKLFLKLYTNSLGISKSEFTLKAASTREGHKLSYG